MQRRVIEYLDGVRPKSVFSVQVPKKNGRLKTWIVPTVNDQIIFQTCLSVIAESLYKRSVNPNRVFSYRYNTDPNRLALIQAPIRPSNEFQTHTRPRYLSEELIHQYDIA